MPDDPETTPEMLIRRVGPEAGLDLDGEHWRRTEPVTVCEYWSGEPAPSERHFEARMEWNQEALFARFDHRIFEPIVMDPDPDLAEKSIGLWDRDVCELFISPDQSEIRRYFEFEAAPNGEWLDLSLEVTSEGRTTDWDFRSRMQVEARIDSGRVSMAIRIPWKAVGCAPDAGDRWRGNLFRAVGEGDGRGYLAWSPTFTDVPNFHVPARFGTFVFTGY